MRLQRARLAARRRDLPAARAELAEAMTLATSIRSPSLLVSGAIVWAEVLQAQGESECARRVLAFAVEQPAMQPLLRQSLRARLAEGQPPAAEPPPWPSLTLDELSHRLVAEAPLEHAPLIALLRSAR
jgi:hypothetical protein